MKKYNIAIVGASGIVGQTVLRILEERGLDKNNLFLFASKKSKGKSLVCGGKRYRVEEITEEGLLQRKFDYALFCCPDKVSARFVKPLARGGCRVIDFSKSFRKDYPLVVPEVNMQEAEGNIICNPNCSTIAGVVALGEIYRRFGLSRIVYSTYQAVSGAGKAALDDMKVKNKEKLAKFDFVIANNLIPYIGDLNASGFSTEEEKMIFETKKIFGDYSIKVAATCVRVPVDVGHCLSISFETRQGVSVEKIRKALENSEGVKYTTYPMPMSARGQDDVLVGRLRQDEFNEKSFSIFVSSDNLRKGAAQNGVQLLEGLMAKDEGM